METITITHDNLEKEHICCAISSAKDIQVSSKKEWIKQQLDHGLIFTKMNVRGKCFIEYIPIENAWIPLDGENLMYIDCFWVAGKFQGLGYAKQLLRECQQRSLELGKKGLVILSSKKKMPYLMDYYFLVKHGFQSVDTWNETYELMFLALDDTAIQPQFYVSDIQEDGLILYYTHQCPFHIKYVALLKDYCKQNQIPLQTVHIQNVYEAKKAPTPLTSYSLFYHKHFITREVLTVKKFEKIWRQIHE